ncbi:hypothetical protein [Pseudomonas syringae]|uniref:hypothetical protein n=1 Tax=Pseudomonas syringae TaxID=317 RepID=UPI001F41DC95|nr:hypothetical protein [Pseudomonas syringae]MCF5733993.1 hypothetical protein [Pseudomonas syringae]MCF5737752.1 hypothetical protein [Pseudomonas syringae]MCF5749153.1 hypothetical protein [Pseudomonas syringae]MCF5754059.1 hypothetical protein [Pseudomonas syringae]
MFNYQPLTIHDVSYVLEALRHVQRPYGDNEGDAINHSAVYYLLPFETQQAVDCAWRTVRDYCVHPGGAVNQRAVTLVCRRGYKTYLGPSQYDSTRLTGSVEIGEWELDLSDEHAEV